MRDTVHTELSPCSPQHYLAKREKNSVGHTPWSTLSTGLLLPTLRMSKEWNTAGKRLNILRLPWDYLPHGRNKVKGPNNCNSFTYQSYWDSLPRCPLGCNAPHDRHHILLECQNAAMNQARQSGLLELAHSIQELRQPKLVKYWGFILDTLNNPDPDRLTSSIMVAMPFQCHLDHWDNLMLPSLFSQNALDTFTRPSASLFNQLFKLSRSLLYTHWREVHPIQLANYIPKLNVQQVLPYTLSSPPASQSSLSTQSSWKNYLDTQAALNPPAMQTNPPLVTQDMKTEIPVLQRNVPSTGTLYAEDPGPHATDLQWEVWNNVT